jgi:hypothetical protein
MKKHNGMRPQDIVILIKILSMQSDQWRNIDIANALSISPSEISEALNRCRIAKLIDNQKRQIFKNSLNEFLIYGLKYVFPAEPGRIVRGIPTAHSASPIKDHLITGEDVYVWPSSEGKARGQLIEPLYPTVPVAVQQDSLFYELMVIVDTIRIGRSREVGIAKIELKNRI